MGVEIERKFLVIGDQWKSQAEPVSYRQGYLNLDPLRNVRVRTGGGQGFLTVKGKSTNLSRPEFEYEIPFSDAEQLLELCEGALIEKKRYKIPSGNHVWEVDEFFGDNQGLVVAEIELTSEEEAFVKPDWIGEEVSHDPKYINARLVQNPFSSWKE